MNINETGYKSACISCFYELGNFNPRKMFRVLSRVIYIIIDRYVCIDYLVTETNKISELRLGYTFKT